MSGSTGVTASYGSQVGYYPRVTPPGCMDTTRPPIRVTDVAHWKRTATRCAIHGCERTRVKGRTTCALLVHYDMGISLYGLTPKARRVREGPLKGLT